MWCIGTFCGTNFWVSETAGGPILSMDPWLSEVAIRGLGRQILNLKTRVRFPVALPNHQLRIYSA
jgi:hypothetical protein